MPDILHDFPINAPPERVFASLSDPRVLDAWWTLRSAGTPRVGETYELFFGEPYDWRATVTRCEPGKAFELRMTSADADWAGTSVAIDLTPIDGGTQVRFAHRGWAEANDHYRTSSFCWAMYLRLMKRHIETGERVPYNIRLDV